MRPGLVKIMAYIQIRVSWPKRYRLLRHSTSPAPPPGADTSITKERKEKQDKTKDTFPLILLSEEKRVAVALVDSSPSLRAGVPSAWCSQRPRQ
jgi:hypothetical protein